MLPSLTPSPNLFHSLGIGIVMADKAPDSHEIYVHIKSLFPMSDGESTVSIDQQSITVKTDDNNEQTSKVLSGAAVPATWKGFDSNRITSPDVREGSQVFIFQIVGSDELYWNAWDLGPEKHRLEHIQYAFNASPKLNENVPFDYENYYVLTISTRNGELSYTTSRANGEPTTYGLKIDSATGQVYLVDGEKNLFLLDSMKRQFLFSNKDGSSIDLTKKNLTIINKGTTSLNSDEKVSIKTKDFKLDCETMNVEAQTTTFDCPVNQFNGNVGVAGAINCTVNKKTGEGGTMKSAGAIHCEKEITSDVDVVAAGISLKNHTHPGSDGPPNK